MRVLATVSTTIVSLLLTATASVAASSGSTSLLISEFRTRGPNGANDEFIELYNRSSSAVSIAGWRIMRSSASGSTSIVLQIPAQTTLAPGGFYLLTNVGAQGFSGTAIPDATYTRSLDDLGGIAILDDQGNVIDQVGVGPNSAYLEGTALAALTLNINQSYERNYGGCMPSQDTDNNAADFRYNGSSSYPQNSTTNCAGGCADVICQAPPDPQCWVSPGRCSNGTCSYQQLAESTVCSDNSVCTVGDGCDASGLCQSGSTVVCNQPPSPYCSDTATLVTYVSPGTCDDVAGCLYTATTTQNCDWGCNGVTLNCNPDPCTNVSCNAPPNDCYDTAGKCQLDGTCRYTLKSAGTTCEDGDLCTANDQCDASGDCLSGAAIPIDDGNACTADACDSATGTVSHIALGNGTICDDGNLCNGVETCQSGSCSAGTAVSCATPPAGGCYQSTGTCSRTTGACTYQPLQPTTACNDGDLCTSGDQCDGNGACTGSTKSCPAFATCTDGITSQLNWSGSCDSANGNCAYSQTNTACTTGCNSSTGLCNADPCASVVCGTPPSTCHEREGLCSNGTCSYQLKPEGSECDDGQACTAVDQCSAAGACQGVPLACNTPPAAASCVDSTTSRSFSVNGTCLTTSGLCDYTHTDVNCPNGCNANTGLCAADPCANVTCDQPPSQCHQNLGTCTNGTCGYALKPAKSPCDDGNLCTDSDVCSAAGACTGTPLVCSNPPNSTCNGSTSRVFNPLGVCNALGQCGYTSTDTVCAAGCNAASGTCNDDPCATVTCNQPPGACSADQGTCNQGICTYPPKPAMVACDDADACTSGDSCDGNGKCSGSIVPGCGAGGTTGSGGSSSATGGTQATAGSSNGGTSNAAGTVATGGNLTTGGALATGGTTGATSSGGANTGGYTSTTTTGTTGVAGSTLAGGSSNTSAGASNTTAGATLAAGKSAVSSVDAGALEPSAENGGCNCSVPRSSNRTAWAVALLAVLLWRRRRKQ